MRTDFELSMAELRAVTAYAHAAADTALPIFDAASPEDSRPRAALDAAALFADGAPRTILQRTAALEAHRAAKAASGEAVACAAHAAGDACAAAYLHPLARATQVGHILRASAYAAAAAESVTGDRAVGPVIIDGEAQRMPAVVLAVLRRYPRAPTGRSRVAQLMTLLDDAARARD